MKKIEILLGMVALAALNAVAQLPTNNIAPAGLDVETDTNGVLIAPTNFFAANSNLLNGAVNNSHGGGGGGGGTNYQSIFTGNLVESNLFLANGQIQATNTNDIFFGELFEATNAGNSVVIRSNGTIAASGAVTAGSFNGPLTGNVTGNASTATFAASAGGAPPTGSAGGTLAGVYPNPTLSPNVTNANNFTGSNLTAFSLTSSNSLTLPFENVVNDLLVVTSSGGAVGETSTPILSGLTVNGAVTATGVVTGNGAGLTNLNAARLTQTNILQFSANFNGANGTLPSGWSFTQGLGQSAVCYITNNALYINAADGYPAWTWLVNTNVYNGSHNFHEHLDVAWLRTNVSSDQFNVGTRSGNPNDDTSWVNTFYLYPGAYSGVIAMYNGVSTNLAANRPADNVNASGTVYPIAATTNIFYAIDLYVDDDSSHASISNRVTGQVSVFDFKQDDSTTNNPAAWFGCSGNFGLGTYSGIYLVTNFTVNLTVPQKVDCVVWGDSILGAGARATNFSESAESKLRGEFSALGLSTVIFGCGSDRSVESCEESNQVAAMNPSLILYGAGGNDIGDGGSQYVINLPALKATFTNAQVVWVAPTCRTATDESPLAYWMLTNAPGQFIDAFSATKTAQANTTMTSMAAGDGVHINSLGHDAVFAAVRRWLRNNGYFVP